MRETRVQFLGREYLLEKEMAIHSSTLAWKIPWTEEPDRLQSMGSQVRKLFSHRLKGFSYIVLTHSGRVHHSLMQYSPLVSFMKPDMIGIKERESESHRGILKKQSCKSIVIMCQFWGVVVGDGIPGCNAPIGFIVAITFLKSVKRCQFLDFFFITKI